MPYIALDQATAEAAPTIPVGAPLTSVGETLASLRAELALQLGNRGDIDPTRLDKWINWAYDDVWTSLELDEAKASYSFNTVAGQPLYTTPYQVVTTLGASVVDSTSIYGGQPLGKTDLRSYRMLENKADRPGKYFRLGNLLVLYPTPDGVYTVVVDFRSRPLPLVQETDSPALAREWHETILLAARKKGFSGILEFDKALPAENDFVNSVRRRQDREADEDEGRVIRSSVPRHGRKLIRKQSYRSPEPE